MDDGKEPNKDEILFESELKNPNQDTLEKMKYINYKKINERKK